MISVRDVFHKLFIANRGEVAVRVARACDALGITPVFGVSEADADAAYVYGRERVVLGPGRAKDSYLDLERVVQAAKQSHCSALHPGWGFLSENPRFATLVAQHGITFLGPPPHVTAKMGRKTQAKALMRSAGLRMIPGSDGVLANVEEARTVAASIGYPVLLKADAGGGGRGMRIVRSESELASAYSEAQAEAFASFGVQALYVEKLIEGGRHVEIQIIADRYGNAVHLGERDCTVQRNHQKLIEESPCPVLDPTERANALSAAVRGAQLVGYQGAGTMEFLLFGGHLHFMEMNCRLQVEHCVTELRTGRDLVIEQIRVAAGHKLSFTQEQVVLDGHAIECRINAENPSENFAPAPGEITKWEAPPEKPGELRIDTHVTTGYVVPPHYDSLLCKVITKARTRDAACDAMIHALGALRCEGVPTTAEFHRTVLASTAFRDCAYDTRSIPGWS